MAKKSKKSKKSRFGNPAKAAADAAARADAMPLRDVRLDRAMEALSPGFALWLESQGRDDADIDMSLMILDELCEASHKSSNVKQKIMRSSPCLARRPRSGSEFNFA